MRIAVIISTYNNPQWLEKTLWGYMAQTRKADEIIIADDGSRPDTAQMLQGYKDALPLKHVWQEDMGFRKTRILNIALRQVTADYVVFTDQDCVPRPDFLAIHERYARPGRFLSGGYFKLPMSISRLISRDDILSGRAFSYAWLKAQGLRWSWKCTKLTCSHGIRSRLLNTLTPTHATWNGMNSSTWLSDLLAAKGFDERMQYGGEDRELGERLVNAGMKGVQIRYSAITLHLDHNRPYVNEEAWKRNNEIRKETRLTRRSVTEHGL